MSIWYYAKDSIQHGPFSLDEMKDKCQKGLIGRKDLVWKEGTPEWVPAEQSELLTLLSSFPASLPP